MAKLTVKFISKVVRIGSSEGTAKRVKERSKAAGKLNMTFGVNVRDKVKPQQSEKSADATHVITIEEDIELDDAIIMGNWLLDRMDKQDNTSGYTDRKASFDSLKRRVLSSFGVEKFDVLTNDERITYAKKMVANNAPFQYTECSLHVKIDDKMTVYSKTFRRMNADHWKQDEVTSLIESARKVVPKKEVILRKVVSASGNNTQGTTP